MLKQLVKAKLKIKYLIPGISNKSMYELLSMLKGIS